MTMTCKRMNTAHEVWTQVDQWAQIAQRSAAREASTRLAHDAALPASFDAVVALKGAEHNALRMAELHLDIQSLLRTLNTKRFAQGCTVPHSGIGNGIHTLL